MPVTPEHCAVCANVRAARKKRGLTQSQMAESLEITQGAYSQFEVGAYSPNYETIVKVARLLGIKPKAIVDMDTPAAREAIRNLEAAVA